MHPFLAIVLRIYLLAVACVDTAWGMQFQRYHTQSEIADFLREQAQQNPEIIKFQLLGKSLQGREIAIVTISKNWSPETPSVYFNGTHHGNEKASTEAILALIQSMVQNRDQEEIDRLLRRYKIILQPLVNPDGHAHELRTDSQGMDPNRDYATPTRPESEAFRLVETRLVRQLLKTERVVASAAFHAGLEAVLWPWCNTPALSQADPIFKKLGQAIAESMNMPKYTQSFHDYQTEGEFIDYAYMQHGVYALTLEVAHEPKPPEDRLEAIVERAIAGSLVFLSSLDRILDQNQAAEKAKDKNKNKNKSKTPSELRAGI